MRRTAARLALERIPGVQRAIVAGEVRRRSEVVRDIVLVLVAEVAPEEIFNRLRELPGVHEFAGQDERRVTLRFSGGSSAQVVVTTPVNLGAVLVQATGSEEHLGQLAQRASSRGFTLNGAALWKGSVFVPTPEEAAFYRALGLDEIPPSFAKAAARSRPPSITGFPG
jgi:DNA polymerase (family 10)